MSDNTIFSAGPSEHESQQPQPTEHSQQPVQPQHAAKQPQQTFQQYMLTEQDKEELFGRESLSPAQKVMVSLVAVLSVAAVIGLGLFIYWKVKDNVAAPQGPAPANQVQAPSANTSADQDKDGLTDAQEAIYKTNPSNPDTDGDGFKDGEEVRNGYNPRGEGRLPTNTTNSNGSNSAR